MKIFSLWSKVSLGLQLLIALVLGVLVALIWPQFSAFYQFLGQAFISLINMVIIPLVFPVVVVAVASVIGKKSFGKLLSKSLLYFFGVTTAITLIFVFASYYLGFGQGVNIGQTGGNIDGIAKSIQLNEFFLSFIPANIVKSLSEGALLPIIVFAIFLGYGLGSLKEDKSQKFIDLLQIWIEAIYKIVGVIIKLSPIGIFGFIAKDVATTGVDKLVGLGQFVAGTYLAYAVLALVIFPLIALISGVPYLTSIRQNSGILCWSIEFDRSPAFANSWAPEFGPNPSLAETGQTIIGGMGELHLDIIVDRMRREFKVEANVGNPMVAYRETIRKTVEKHEYTHKKQTGGSGQFARVIIALEPLPADSEEEYMFEDKVTGGRVPREYIPSVDAGISREIGRASCRERV